MGMTKEAMSPMFGGQTQEQSAPTVPPAAAAGGWDCACGQRGVTGNFCPNCGAKKSAPADAWDCACGQTGITSKFCPNCGAKRPAPADTWDCACGQKGLTGKFCHLRHHIGSTRSLVQCLR